MKKLFPMCFLVVVALAAGIDLGRAQQREPAITLYHSRYLLAGFLLRAGNVCEKDAKQTISTAFQIVSDPEMKAMSKGFPELTARWMTEGSENFNRQVMKGGLLPACDFASKAQAQAAQLDSPPPSKK